MPIKFLFLTILVSSCKSFRCLIRWLASIFRRHSQDIFPEQQNLNWAPCLKLFLMLTRMHHFFRCKLSNDFFTRLELFDDSYHPRLIQKMSSSHIATFSAYVFLHYYHWISDYFYGSYRLLFFIWFLPLLFDTVFKVVLDYWLGFV